MTTPTARTGVHPVDLRLANEFASVTVRLDETGNGPRLCVVDDRSGRHRYLDPVEMESIVWADDRRLAGLVDPSAGRWADDGQPEPRSVLAPVEPLPRSAGGGR